MSEKTLAIVWLLGLALTGIDVRAQPAADGRHGKEGALAFAETIVQTYLDGDGQRFKSYLAETLYTLEGEGPFPAEAYRPQDPFPNGRDYSHLTMADVKAAHSFLVYSHDEYSERFPELAELEVNGWRPDADDYLFVGNEVEQAGDPARGGILWDDFMVFMVTYQNGKWELLCLSG